MKGTCRLWLYAHISEGEEVLAQSGCMHTLVRCTACPCLPVSSQHQFSFGSASEEGPATNKMSGPPNLNIFYLYTGLCSILAEC